MYPSRSLAAKAAKKMYDCFCTKPLPVGTGWFFVGEDRPNALFKYAEAWAADKDYISHVEQDVNSVEIVVRCFKKEIPDPVPQGCKYVPLTPSLWEAQTRVKVAKAVQAVKTPSPPSWAILAPVPAPSAPVAPPVVASTVLSPVKLVWTFCAANPAMDRKALIASLVAQGVHPATAAKQYSLWKKSAGAA